MTVVAAGVLFVGALAWSLTRLEHHTKAKLKPSAHNLVTVVSMTVRIAVFFVIAHMIWTATGSAGRLISFIFIGAIVQMSVQIYLLNKGRA